MVLFLLVESHLVGTNILFNKYFDSFATAIAPLSNSGVSLSGKKSMSPRSETCTT